MTIGKIVHKLETCTSTNDVAREFAEDGFEEGMVILADSQLAGRGTHGRAWHSPKGKGLYLSVILRPDDRTAPLVPLVGGLALREAVAAFSGVRPDLKWPNDVTWKGRKLAGILCESSWSGPHLNYVILGLGLNIDFKAEDFPPDLRDTATSLAIITGRTPAKDALLAVLYPALNRWYDVLRSGRSGELIRAAERAMHLHPGQAVTVETETGLLAGTFGGLRPDGTIGLSIDGEVRTFPPSEVLALKAD